MFKRVSVIEEGWHGWHHCFLSQTADSWRRVCQPVSWSAIPLSLKARVLQTKYTPTALIFTLIGSRKALFHSINVLFVQFWYYYQKYYWFILQERSILTDILVHLTNMDTSYSTIVNVLLMIKIKYNNFGGGRIILK